MRVVAIIPFRIGTIGSFQFRALTKGTPIMVPIMPIDLASNGKITKKKLLVTA